MVVVADLMEVRPIETIRKSGFNKPDKTQFAKLLRAFCYLILTAPILVNLLPVIFLQYTCIHVLLNCC